MYVRTNVAKPSGSSPGASAPKEPNLALVADDDILFEPIRNSKGVKMEGNYIIKPGAKMIEVYMTPSKSKASYESDGDEDAVSIKQKFECEHPGNELEISEFAQNWLGVNCRLIYGSCSDNFRKVLGTKCAPIQMKPSLQDDADARKHMFVFEQTASSKWVPGHYTGALVFADPANIANAGAVALTVANGAVYKLPSLEETAAVVFNSIEHEHGTIITLMGGGGDDPATLSSGVLANSAILKDGVAWVGLEGAVINFQVFDAGANKYLIEVSRK
ncbi:MAG: hypothetical protein BGO88_04845 [Flavobacterium sp. 38-13]|uniref:hypothetical protein n=1 Tax=Flavobacterium sp. 38-13 TaxID=1896168 RepID=UPI000969AE7E|nr:hypothetical protein [Flavobacterium sp. 38-13]OJX55545.1 MAG: hypothetical protein BGO88_04845 [Flavobacterium sp. 38-13]